MFWSWEWWFHRIVGGEWWLITRGQAALPRFAPHPLGTANCPRGQEHQLHHQHRHYRGMTDEIFLPKGTIQSNNILF